MTPLQWITRFLIVALIMHPVMKMKKKIRTEKFIVLTFALHIIVLVVFFTETFYRMNISYLLFDVIWWSASFLGVVCCIDLLKGQRAILNLIILTTFIFLLFLPVMILLNNM